MIDEFGDRMKEYELRDNSRKTLNGLPVIARLDGKNFSSWTSRLDNFDLNFHKAMIHVVNKLMEETNAQIGYTQSDEISLCWLAKNYNSQIWFDGRIQKMTSVLASMCTYHFNKACEVYFKDARPAFFDCRVWEVPSIVEAANTFLWRKQDAERNSKLNLAQSKFSHKQVQGLSTKKLVELLAEQNVIWDDLDEWKKQGVLFLQETCSRKFTILELESLPSRHEARKNPDLEFERSYIKEQTNWSIKDIINVLKKRTNETFEAKNHCSVS